MKPVYKLLFVVLLSTVFSYSYAQTDTTLAKKSSFKFGISYLSNDVYLGRTDTVGTPTLIPAFTYTLKSGLYFSGALDYITNRKKNNLDGGNIEAGYNYTVGENFEGGVSFTKMFYSANSTQVSSSISSVFNAFVDYDIAGIITPAISLSYNIGKSGSGGDFIFNPNISHDFEITGVFTNTDKLTISPQAGITSGSQNYYAGYLERKGRLNRKGVNAAYTAYDDALGTFRMLDTEVSAPLEYQSGHFIFTVTPTYAFASNSLPQNTAAEKLITKTVETSAPYKPSIFYVETGIALKF